MYITKVNNNIICHVGNNIKKRYTPNKAFQGEECVISAPFERFECILAASGDLYLPFTTAGVVFSSTLLKTNAARITRFKATITSILKNIAACSDSHSIFCLFFF